MAMQAATLEILEKADLPLKQARAIAQAIELEVAAGHSVLATRADLLGFKHEVESQYGGLKQHLETMIVSTKHDLELKMSDHKSELVRWVFVCMLGQTAMLLGVGYFLFSHIAA
jgi:hypothetical protein